MRVENSYSNEVLTIVDTKENSNSKIKVGVAIRSHRLVRAMSVIISIIVLTMSGLLLLFPPVGWIIAFIIGGIVILFNINLMSSLLIVDEDGIKHQSLLSTKLYRYENMSKIKSMKVLGTVSNSPFAIRSVGFEDEKGKTEIMKTMIYPWYLVLDLLDYLVSENKVEPKKSE